MKILHSETKTFNPGEYVTLEIIEDQTGIHWQIESDAWNEVQPPDPTLPMVVADLIHNMQIYQQAGVTYANSLLAMAKRLKKSLR